MASSSINPPTTLPVLSSLFYLAAFCIFLLSPIFAHANSCVTADCHPGLIKKSVVHQAAADDCLGCHQRKVEAHPVKGGKSFALVAEGMALCSRCHDEKMVKGKFGHGPAVNGNCMECHDIHSADHKHLLRQEEQELCFKCHQDFKTGLQSAAVVHDPVKSQPCTSCHEAHSGPHESLLKGKMEDVCAECHAEIGDKVKKAKTKHMPLYRKEACGSCHLVHFGERKNLLQFSEKELCLDCHGKDNIGKSDGLKNIKKELEGKKHLHGPIKEEKCSVCHDPHGSANPRLLTGTYPSDFYANYKPGMYGFCLGCHEENLLRFPETTVNTEFRNGNKNLHFIHSARKLKGRTCRTCHEPHASDGDKLITAEGASFGSWKIPIRFVLMETGGSCSPGCHQTKRYDRVHPVDYSGAKAQKTAGVKEEKRKDEGKHAKKAGVDDEGLGAKESLGEKDHKGTKAEGGNEEKLGMAEKGIHEEAIDEEAPEEKEKSGESEEAGEAPPQAEDGSAPSAPTTDEERPASR